jgi:isopentenyldiphosphate isomerase
VQDEIYDIFDRRGRRIGRATWTDVHAKGLIHRTAAVLVFKDASRRELLVQKRSAHVVQSPNTWVHSAGGHVLAGKTAREGIKDELKEELFARGTLPDIPIRYVTRYFHNDLPNNYEFLSVFEMIYPGPFSFGKKEVAGLKWMGFGELLADMKQHPKRYAPAFHLVMKHYLAAKRAKRSLSLRGGRRPTKQSAVK